MSHVSTFQFLIETSLTYNVTLVSGVQCYDLIFVYICIDHHDEAL